MGDNDHEDVKYVKDVKEVSACARAQQVDAPLELQDSKQHEPHRRRGGGKMKKQVRHDQSPKSIVRDSRRSSGNKKTGKKKPAGGADTNVDATAYWRRENALYRASINDTHMIQDLARNAKNKLARAKKRFDLATNLHRMCLPPAICIEWPRNSEVEDFLWIVSWNVLDDTADTAHTARRTENNDVVEGIQQQQQQTTRVVFTMNMTIDTTQSSQKYPFASPVERVLEGDEIFEDVLRRACEQWSPATSPANFVLMLYTEDRAKRLS